MEEALKLINQPVVFRHNGSNNPSIGVIKGIYEGKSNKAIIAVVKLEKTAKKSGFLSKVWKSFIGEDDEVRIPINFLQVLTDVKIVKKNTRTQDGFTDNIKPSTDIPTEVSLKGVRYTTMLSLKSEDFNNISNNINRGDDVIWNKYSNQELNPIGSVAYFAYKAKVLGELTVRVCVDFVDQPRPTFDFQDEFLTRVLCKDKGILFRYCVPREQLMGLEEYLLNFQLSQQTPLDNANIGNENVQSDEEKNLMDFEDSDSVKPEDGLPEKVGHKKEQNHFPDSSARNSNDDFSKWTWTTVDTNKRRQNVQKSVNSNYGTHSSHYQWKKKFFALCCAQTKCDVKNEEIPLASAVVYLQTIPEPTFGKVLWIGNVGLKNHPELEGEIYVDLQFESSIRGDRHIIIHAENCDCKENHRFLISLVDVQNSTLFNVYPADNNEEDDKSELIISDEEMNDFANIPPLLPLQSLLTRLEHSDQWGFQGCNNSCYADTTMFTLFAFTDVFDSILDVNRLVKDEASAATENELLCKKSVQILRKYIVGPIRSNFYVSKESVARLRVLMSTVNPDFKNCHMDVEDFMLCLFDTVLGVPGFFKYDKDYSDFIHQIMLPQLEEPSTFKECSHLQQIVNESFFTSQVQLEDVPHPGFLIKLPVCDGKLMSSKYILPDLKLDLTNILKNAIGKTYMDLFSVICLRDSHFTCFIHTKANWIFYDSNPTEKRPKVVHIPALTETLQYLHSKVSQNKEFNLERYFRMNKEDYAQYLMSCAYICVYIR